MGDIMNGNILYEIEFGGSNIVEIIVKYNGNIDRIANEVGAFAEILSNSFAILTIAVNEIENLSKFNEIIYIELPNLLRLFIEESKIDSCIRNYTQNIGTGNGVLIGIIDSGISDNISFQDRIKYRKDFDTTNDTSHGTAVASIINNIAPEADIAFVSIGRNDFFASDTDIMRGIKFIADSAAGAPFVINISYGTNSGSHNGNTLFEEYIDEVCQNYRCSIVVATGNEGDKGRHYENTINDSDDNIEFNIDGGLPFAVLEIWKNFTDKFSYEIISPSGDRSGIISSAIKQTNFILGDNKIYFIFTEPSPYNIQEQVYIRIEGIESVSRGIWRLIISPVSIVEGNFNIWSTQARFLQPNINTTLTVPSTALRVISVAAYNSITNSQTAFSGRGFNADNIIKPDISAPGVDISINGDTLTGTSFATPFVTGCCAVLMEWGIVKGNDLNMYGERLKAYLRLGAIRDRETYPNKEFGYGKLCLENTFSNMISVKAFEINEPESNTIINYDEDNINPAYSNENIDLILRNTEDVIRRLDSTDTPYCKVKNGDLLIAYPRTAEYNFALAFGEISQYVQENRAVICGLMSEEFNLAAGITRVQRPPLDLRGNGVVIGFVDTGINYDNEEFLYENGDNRVYSIWDMTVEDEKSDNVCFGRVYTNEEITSKTAPTRDTVGHGTAMAIQACGNSGAAPESTIISVKLKQAKPYMYESQFIDSSVPAYSTSDIILGIDFIIKEATKISMPVVIVLGIGTNEGGHDGSTVFERYLERLGEMPGLVIVVPTGNEAIARHHCSFSIDDDREYYDIEINVSENVAGFNMWIWNLILDKIEVSIISPLGQTINRIPAVNNFTNEYTLFQSNSSVRVSYTLPVFQTTDQRTTISFKNPISGIWKVRVYGKTEYSKINAWLPISPFIGQRAVFVTPDSSITATVPSTAENIMVVGGYSPNENSVIAASGRGPTRGSQLIPFFAAPTESYTSISAAVTAGAVALLMEWALPQGNVFLINSITATALIINSTSQNSGEIYPNNISGFGLLNLYNVFNNL